MHKFPIPLVLTCTVNIQDSSAKLSNSSDRLLEYREAIRYWLDYGVKKIYLCENSNTPILNEELLVHASNLEAELYEFVFEGNYSLIAEYGKGFGEGEMLDKFVTCFTANESEFGFFKITGRLTIPNLYDISQTVIRHQLSNLFFVNSSINVDTRLYYVSRNFYENNLLDCYKSVRDREGFFLENSVAKVLNNKIEGRVACSFPKFIGISGSTGESYQLSYFKYFIKNRLGLIGWYARVFN